MGKQKKNKRKLTGGTGLIKGRVKGPKKRTIIQSAIGTKTKTAKGVVESHKITKAIMRQVAPVLSQTASKDVAARTQAARMARLDFGTQKSKRMRRQQQIPVVRAGRSLAIEVESTTSNPGLPPTETSNVVGKSSWMAPASFVAPVSRVDAMEKSQQSVFANEMMVSLEQSSEQLLQQRRLEELQRIERLQRLGTTKLRIPKTKPSGNVFAALDDDSSDSETPRGESEFKRVFKAPTLTSAGTLVPEKELEHKYYNPSDVTVKIAPPTFMFNPHVLAKGAQSTNVDEDDDDL